MKVLIVGGVAGGAGVAARLRRNSEDAEIIVFEKGPHISFANCGLPYYIGNTIKEPSSLLLQTPQSFNARFNTDVRVGHEVVEVCAKEGFVKVKNHASGQIYEESYNKLVLSPGAVPIVPGFAKEKLPHVFTLRNIPDTHAIKLFLQTARPKSCAIIGGGFIGLEMAENLAQQGIKVNIVEMANHVLPSLDLDMAHQLHNYIRQKGIGLFLGKACTGITGSHVLLKDKSSILADMVILSLGVLPDTGFLQNSGIALGAKKEIVVDQYMQTSFKDIYALGDAVSVKNLVNGRQMLVPLASPANKQARLLADNICQKQRPYRGSQATAILKFFDYTIATTGEKEENLKKDGVLYQKVLSYSASNAGYYPGGQMMAIKLLFAQDSLKILGAQIVGGKGVDKRIDSFANALRFGLDIYDLQEMELAYAPPYSSAKDPVNMAGYVAGNVAQKMANQFYIEDVKNIPKAALCIDVREPEEFAQGHIPGFINLPLGGLRQNLKKLDLEKDIYITCQIGLRGYIAQRILMHHGAKTHNLAGGYRFYQEMTKDKDGKG